MFTKSCLGKCSKICVSKTKEGLKAPESPLRLPQGGETCGFKSPFKGLTAFHFCKSWRVFDCYFGVKKRVSSSNKGLAGLQRARRRVATGRSLQSNSSPVAEQGGPYGAPPRPSPRGGRAAAIHKRLCDSDLQKMVAFLPKKPSDFELREI